jgi:hypothetical protein
MPEATPSKLETKRFVINPESSEAMRKVQAALPKLQEQYPFFIGVGFFGSRTKGMEHPGSDFDVRIFYDSIKSKELSNTLGGLLPSVPYISLDNKYDLAVEVSKTAGFNIDTKHDGWFVDISKERTDSYISNFIEVVSKYIDNSLTEDQVDGIRAIPPIQNLQAHFFLAVGEGVYVNRTYILNQFKQMPQGEQYFQVLMRCLAVTERASNHKYPTPAYDHLPKTIAEAEKYFLTRPDLLEESSAAA